MDSKTKSLVEVHLAVFLFGVAGLFGKLLSLPAAIIVLGRVFFSSLFLGALILYLKQNVKLDKKRDYYYLVLMGLILAVHWSAFFQSIQMSTVAIGLLTFATFPVFVTFLEPIFFGEKLQTVDIFTALITFAGVAFVIPKFELGSQILQGVLIGLVSSFTYAVLSILNRKFARIYPSTVIAFYEQLVALVALIPFYFLYRPVLQINDLLLLVLLGIVFTGIAHTLFIQSLKNIRTYTAGIISNLEPVYGIIIAIILIKEIPGFKEVIGGLLILSTVFYSTLKAKGKG
ncbi:MAG: DMT family transporter [Bacillota bacterium]